MLVNSKLVCMFDEINSCIKYMSATQDSIRKTVVGKYVLSERALKECSKASVRLQLAGALGVTEYAVVRYIRINSDKLTKAASMEVIRRETGMTDKQILAESGQ